MSFDDNEWLEILRHLRNKAEHDGADESHMRNDFRRRRNAAKGNNTADTRHKTVKEVALRNLPLCYLSVYLFNRQSGVYPSAESYADRKQSG